MGFTAGRNSLAVRRLVDRRGDQEGLVRLPARDGALPSALSSPWSWPVACRGARGQTRPGGMGRRRQEGGRAGLGEGADLVAGDGFLLEQGGGELVEGLSVLGEQVAGSGFRPGQQGGDFLVDEPLGVLGVAALRRAREARRAGRCS